MNTFLTYSSSQKFFMKGGPKKINFKFLCYLHELFALPVHTI